VNTIIQKKGIRLALFTTRNFEDALEPATLKLPKSTKGMRRLPKCPQGNRQCPVEESSPAGQRRTRHIGELIFRILLPRW
jgi:N-methylhydantoinase A